MKSLSQNVSIALDVVMDQSTNGLSFSSYPLEQILTIVLVQFQCGVGPKSVYPSKLVQINSLDLNFKENSEMQYGRYNVILVYIYHGRIHL